MGVLENFKALKKAERQEEIESFRDDFVAAISKKNKQIRNRLLKNFDFLISTVIKKKEYR